METLELLPIYDCKVLKIIQITGTDGCIFSGYLPYLRNYHPVNYNSQQEDFLDKEILTTIQKIYPNARFAVSRELIFKGQIDEIRNNYNGAKTKNIMLRLYPHIPFELIPQLVGQLFKEYHLQLVMRILYAKCDCIDNYILDSFDCPIEYDKIKDIAKTIESF